MIEKPAYTYDNTYSYYLQMIYIISFYGFLVPLTVPITIVAFALQYWVDKNNLFKKCSSPVDLGFSLTSKMWMALELSLLFTAIGHFVWSLSLKYHSPLEGKIINYVSIFLSIAYTVLVFVFRTKTQ